MWFSNGNVKFNLNLSDNTNFGGFAPEWIIYTELFRKEIIKKNIMNRKDNSTQLSDDIMSESVNLIMLGYIIRYFLRLWGKSTEEEGRTEYCHYCWWDENVMEGRERESSPMGEIALPITPRHTPPDTCDLCHICFLFSPKYLLSLT